MIFGICRPAKCQLSFFTNTVEKYEDFLNFTLIINEKMPRDVGKIHLIIVIF